MVNQSKIVLTDREKIVIKKAHEIGFIKGYKKREEDHNREIAELMQSLEGLE